MQQTSFPPFRAGIEGSLHIGWRTRVRVEASFGMAVLVWRVLAILCIGLGLIGILLPVLPTVPFLLAAAAAASRGWPWLDDRLTSHPTYGPMILHWRERRAIPRRAKWFATAGMAFSATVLWWSPAPLWLRVTVPAILLIVGAWIWWRPED